MSGTLKGGRKAAKTNRVRYGKDFYAKIGAKGGKLGTTGGFAASRTQAVEAGRKAGKISKRGHRYIETKRGYNYYTKIATGETVRYKA